MNGKSKGKKKKLFNDKNIEFTIIKTIKIN